MVRELQSRGWLRPNLPGRGAAGPPPRIRGSTTRATGRRTLCSTSSCNDDVKGEPRPHADHRHLLSGTGNRSSEYRPGEAAADLISAQCVRVRLASKERAAPEPPCFSPSLQRSKLVVWKDPGIFLLRPRETPRSCNLKYRFKLQLRGIVSNCRRDCAWGI